MFLLPLNHLNELATVILSNSESHLTRKILILCTYPYPEIYARLGRIRVSLCNPS